MLLKLARLAYRVDTAGFRKAPTGKLPYIDDDGTIVARLDFIRLHLEREPHRLRRRSRSPSGGRSLGRSSRCARTTSIGPWSATARIDQANFAKARRVFDKVPAPVRPLVVAVIRRKVRSALKAHGLGRHTPEEIAGLLGATSMRLRPCSARSPISWATSPAGRMRRTFAFAAGLLCPTSRRRRAARPRNHPNLVAYRESRWPASSSRSRRRRLTNTGAAKGPRME